jgi:hypothetical protein
LFIVCIACFRSLSFRRFIIREDTRLQRRRPLSSSKREARQVFFDNINPICFLPLVTLLHASRKLNTYVVPLGLGLYGWVDLLSPAVMSVIQDFHLL